MDIEYTQENTTVNTDSIKKCFIITPIGSLDSNVFRHINGVIQNVIRPTLNEFGFNDIRAAHEISEPGSINNQIINRIVEDDLVIANLTDNNPNVMYELCLRHIVAKPVIHICEKNTTLPFDIIGERTIFYTNDMYGGEELKIELRNVLNNIKYDKEYRDNPIYNALQLRSLLKNDVSNKDIDTVMLQMIYTMSAQINEIREAIIRSKKSKFILFQLNSNDIKTNEHFIKILRIKLKLFNSTIITLNKARNEFNVLIPEIYSRMEIRGVIQEIADYENMTITFLQS